MSKRSKFCCPTCGHPILPTDPLAMLSPSERAIFDVIYRSGQVGVSRQAVFCRVYGDRDRHESIVSVHVSNANQKLRLIHLEIWADRGGSLGHEAIYRVRRLPQDLAQREGNGVCAS